LHGRLRTRERAAIAITSAIARAITCACAIACAITRAVRVAVAKTASRGLLIGITILDAMARPAT
jgi:hypothetical protein